MQEMNELVMLMGDEEDNAKKWQKNKHGKRKP
jgi:hypothetical protein